MSRIVCQFSCGAASAVATKLALAQFGKDRVVIVNAFIKEEHEDNRRFLVDCERWFEHPITVLQDEKYGASVDIVWTQRRFMKGPRGAPCSQELKRKVLNQFIQPSDRLVFGFTVEELDRADLFPDGLFPLIDASLTHADCLGVVDRAGIQLPEMYRLGFNNANCIGCPKGGEGYWNHIRKVFPQRFSTVMEIQERIGPGAYFHRNRVTNVRFGLKDLDPHAGRHDEPLPSCSFYCVLAEQDMNGNAHSPARPTEGGAR